MGSAQVGRNPNGLEKIRRFVLPAESDQNARIFSECAIPARSLTPLPIACHLFNSMCSPPVHWKAIRLQSSPMLAV
jgi:hypothetical protein